MASSFINFNNNGFWVNDRYIEAFQLMIFEEINNQFGDELEWLNRYQKELAQESLPLISGGMSMCFDETLTDLNRSEIILQLIHNINNRIISDKNYLTGNHLNSLRKTVREYLVNLKEYDWDAKEIEKQINDGAFGDKLQINNYLNGFDLLSRLIAGQLQYKAESPITYWKG